VVSALGGLQQAAVVEEIPISRASQVNCYIEQGGAKVVAGSGCEYEFQSGSTLDIQSGTDFDLIGGNWDLNGTGVITLDADADTLIGPASPDDVVTATLGAATGHWDFATGNVKVGNGSPSTSQDGEDLYVEGGLEVDGTARFDGAIDANSSMDLAGNLTSATGAVTVADTLQVTGVADFDAGMTFGPTPLYPLGIATASQEIECGTTGTFTASTLITFSTLNTPTYALAMQVTAPTTTAAYLYVSDPTTTTITLTSLENDFTAGTTGITAHYCAVGTE
jgi:hypothetical protein